MLDNIFPSLKRASFSVAGALACALIAIPFAQSANAQEYTERSKVTFNTPVEVPGHVILQPGTYIFELQTTPNFQGSTTRLDRVQIFNEAQTKVFATVNTVPIDVAHAAAHTTVTFEETPAGQPQRLHEFIFGGSTHGHQFVY